jgi:alpha-mannosidase
MNVTLITTDGSKRKVNITTFDEARQLVCNYQYNSSAEIVVLMDGSFMLIDEEAKLKNLDLNEIATQIAKDNNCIYPSDYIAGDVIMVDDSDEFDSLPYE